jgi:hypothetical protein
MVVNNKASPLIVVGYWTVSVTRLYSVPSPLSDFVLGCRLCSTLFWGVAFM